MLLGRQSLPQPEARHSLVPFAACASRRLVPSALRAIGAPLDPSGILALAMATRRKQECALSRTSERAAASHMGSEPSHGYSPGAPGAGLHFYEPRIGKKECVAVLGFKAVYRSLCAKRFTAQLVKAAYRSVAKSGLPLNLSKRLPYYRSVAQSGLPLSRSTQSLKAAYRSVAQSG